MCLPYGCSVGTGTPSETRLCRLGHNLTLKEISYDKYNKHQRNLEVLTQLNKDYLASDQNVQRYDQMLAEDFTASFTDLLLQRGYTLALNVSFIFLWIDSARVRCLIFNHWSATHLKVGSRTGFFRILYALVLDQVHTCDHQLTRSLRCHPGFG